MSLKKRLSIEEYYAGMVAGNRVVLGQAITLVESTLQEDEATSSQLLDKILPLTGNSLRLGITGVPGVGKSTFIETFGNYLTGQQKRVAVLTIDPSSQLTRGSILGDKTRMESLAKNPNAFIRPTASGSVLGGVANRTRECILLCEAAGFDVVIVETVGTGQSETVVKNMVDFFLLLMLAGAGDELQGIKKGIMEMADAVVITKADGENVSSATKAAAEYQFALHLFQGTATDWTPKVLTCSALENKGIAEVWKMIVDFEIVQKANGYFTAKRKEQNVNWMHENFDLLIKKEINKSTELKHLLKTMEKKVKENELTPIQASASLHKLFLQTRALRS
jgi:LAO/AO transport system kinase